MVALASRLRAAALLFVCLGAALPHSNAQFSWPEVASQDALQQGQVFPTTVFGPPANKDKLQRWFGFLIRVQAPRQSYSEGL